MYDVAIIGAGVVGSAIARELSRYQANICVIEREEDVCNGTSKANSAIIHAGFDATPGYLKSPLKCPRQSVMDELSRELDIPFSATVRWVVCTKDQEPLRSGGIIRKRKGKRRSRSEDHRARGAAKVGAEHQ